MWTIVTLAMVSTPSSLFRTTRRVLTAFLFLALDNIRRVADFINEAKRQAEQNQAMTLITTKLHNYPENAGVRLPPPPSSFLATLPSSPSLLNYI